MSRPTAQVSAPRSATGGDPGITRVPILAYHSIFPGANTSWRRYVVSPTLFDEHVSALREQGYVSMTVDALVRAIARGQPLPAKPVVLTFDDGFADFVSNALPVIARRHMSATLYVTTGFVGKRSPWRHRADADTHEPMLSWADVRSL
ncbi:MAG TPA: polysaccharide deacetylase family protein, partial [Chloroflexota bacterium]|nr:polysaccharide deacetylase family protein [Chloroflexota bacterium]